MDVPLGTPAGTLLAHFAVPEPGPTLLVGFGLLGIGMLRRR